MTALQALCARLAVLHQPGEDGCCRACRQWWPCPRARLAAARPRSVFLAFSNVVPGCRTEAAGHPPRPAPSGGRL